MILILFCLFNLIYYLSTYLGKVRYVIDCIALIALHFISFHYINCTALRFDYDGVGLTDYDDDDDIIFNGWIKKCRYEYSVQYSIG